LGSFPEVHLNEFFISFKYTKHRTLWIGGILKRKIIVMLAMTLFSAILALSLTKVQAAPEEFYVYAWVDKVQYKPGDSGTLYITIRNDMTDEVYVYNVTIIFPWHAYVEDHWEGNDTVEVKTAIEREGGVINEELTFEVPKDGRAITSLVVPYEIGVVVYTDELGLQSSDNSVLISVANPPVHMAITGMDMWMTSLTVVIVICTIILAIVIFLSTRETRAPRMVAPPPPPPKAKAA